ncbi:MAG: hypothetical protein PWP41_1832 [Moorella sp. (in: firmicutes)]|nr:hypothetical protein [Moorella sp. (in: firmicutes)]
MNKMGIMIIGIMKINIHQKLNPWLPIKNPSYFVFNGNRKNRKKIGMIMMMGIMIINHHKSSCVIKVSSFH